MPKKISHKCTQIDANKMALSFIKGLEISTTSAPLSFWERAEGYHQVNPIMKPLIKQDFNMLFKKWMQSPIHNPSSLLPPIGKDKICVNACAFVAD